MKREFSVINKELRMAGRFIKFFNPSFTEKRLRLMHKLSRIRRSKIKSDKMSISVDWVVRNDGSKIRICIFRPLIPKENVPGVLWIHGGGYALGSPEVSKFYAEKLIEVSNCVFIAPEYRLSIEAPYPAALEDNYDVLCWMKKNAANLGINVNQLMVGGDSAGGGLTSALTLYARDQGDLKIAFQMPLYPMIDDRMTTPSATENNAPVWDSTSNYNAWKLYLGKQFGTSDVPSYAAPARASDYQGLPSTVTFVGDLEPFRDETIRYVENLRNAGVPVDFQVFEGCYHAFDQMVPNAEVSRKAIAFLVSSYRFAINNYFAAQDDSK